MLLSLLFEASVQSRFEFFAYLDRMCPTSRAPPIQLTRRIAGTRERPDREHFLSAPDARR